MIRRMVAVGAISSGLLFSGCTAVPEGVGIPEASPNSGFQVSPGTGASPNITATGNNAVTVSVVRPGNSVTVDDVTLANAGFIVVHRVNADGTTGNSIGESIIFSGNRKNIMIRTREAVKTGDRLTIMLHRDVNSNNRVEFPGPDVPVQDEAGNPVQTELTVTAAQAASPSLRTLPPATGTTR